MCISLLQLLPNHCATNKEAPGVEEDDEMSLKTDLKILLLKLAECVLICLRRITFSHLALVHQVFYVN